MGGSSHVYFLIVVHSNIKRKHVIDSFLPHPHNLSCFYSLKYLKLQILVPATPSWKSGRIKMCREFVLLIHVFERVRKLSDHSRYVEGVGKRCIGNKKIPTHIQDLSMVMTIYERRD